VLSLVWFNASPSRALRLQGYPSMDRHGFASNREVGTMVIGDLVLLQGKARQKVGELGALFPNINTGDQKTFAL